MKIKSLKDLHDGTSLKKDKIYEAKSSQKGWLAVIDESGEEYAYPPDIFEIINEDDLNKETIILNMIKEKFPARSLPKEVMQAIELLDSYISQSSSINVN